MPEDVPRQRHRLREDGLARTVSRRWTRAIIAALSISLGHGAVAGPVENHRIRGWTLAAEHCSQCHLVGNGAQEGGSIGPAFTAVAAMPSTTGMALNIFLQSHHRRMPSLRLDRDEMDAVIDYILSLKVPQPAGR